MILMMLFLLQWHWLVMRIIWSLVIDERVYCNGAILGGHGCDPSHFCAEAL